MNDLNDSLRQPLTRRFLDKPGSTALTIAVLFLALIAYQIHASYLTAKESAATQAKNLSLALEAKLNTDFEAAERNVSELASKIDAEAMQPEMVGRHGPQITHQLKNQVRDISSASALRVFDANGDRLYSSIDGETATNIADRAFFQQLKADPGSPVIFTEVAIGRFTKRASMYVVKPIRDQAGAFLGLAVAALDLGNLQEQFSRIELGKKGAVELRRIDNGALVVRHPGLVEVDNAAAPNIPVRLAILKDGPQGAGEIESTADGVRRIYGYHTIGKFPFFIAAGIAENDYLAEWRRNSALSLISALLLLALTAVAESRRHRAEISLRESDEFKNAVLNSMNAQIAVLDSDGVIVAVNKAWRRFARINGTEPGRPARHTGIGVNYLEICRSSTGDAGEEACNALGGIVQVLDGRAPAFSLEYPCHSGTEQRWFTLSATPLGVKARGAVIAHTNITVRKQAELQFLRANSELEKQSLLVARSNAELLRFAEINAHHLQEPARRLANYAERLTQQLDWRIEDGEARQSLEFIGQQARRQLNLLRDIDGFLMANQPRGKIGKMDAGEAVHQVLEWLSARIAETGATVTVGDLPPAWIDALRLAELFEVALENALQYGAAARRPDDRDGEDGKASAALRITINGERVGAIVRYRISDNGPGIEEEYRERVFRVFERLASGREASTSTSTGVGLALLRRIAESRGGCAWIEETPGGGCSVLFDLPAEEEA
ncbi:ATP-binding protein [Propionivibrio sp.]|uniref:ATP-binding protein n=1 Tax=Propionivibrio sp. TaxID=2212460 RepID=UPI003BF1B8D2